MRPVHPPATAADRRSLPVIWRLTWATGPQRCPLTLRGWSQGLDQSSCSDSRRGTSVRSPIHNQVGAGRAQFNRPAGLLTWSSSAPCCKTSRLQHLRIPSHPDGLRNLWSLPSTIIGLLPRAMKHPGPTAHLSLTTARTKGQYDVRRTVLYGACGHDRRRQLPQEQTPQNCTNFQFRWTCSVQLEHCQQQTVPWAGRSEEQRRLQLGKWC
jgi:hypothetical protein